MGDVCSNRCLEVIESRDFEILERLIFDEDIIKGLLSENYLYQENKLDNEKFIFYLFKIDNDPIGICILHNVSEIFDSSGIYWVDIGFVNEIRGKFAYKLALMAKKKFFTEINPNKLYTRIKVENKKSIFFAMRAGFVIINRNSEYCFLEAIWEA